MIKRILYAFQIIITSFIIFTCVFAYALLFEVLSAFILIILAICAIGSLFLFAIGIDKLNNNKKEKIR